MLTYKKKIKNYKPSIQFQQVPIEIIICLIYKPTIVVLI